MSHSAVSVVVMARDAASDIEACLASVPGAGETIVADTGSTDGTPEKAAAAGARVHALAWRGFGPTRAEAFSLATGEWIFWLDADERVTPQLWEEIGRAVTAADGTSGYLVKRRANFLGRWMRGGGWGRDTVLRLFRADDYTVRERDVHESVAVDGPIAGLSGELEHLTDPTLEHYLNKFNRYTSLAATQMQAAGKRARITDLLVRPPATFTKMYVLRAGFIDGFHGLVLATLSSAYVFVKYAKLYCLNRKRNG